MRFPVFRPLLLVALVAGGVLSYKTAFRPEPMRLATWAEGALSHLFGNDVTHGTVTVDLLDGVRIVDLRVQKAGDPEPRLFAGEIVIRHDVLALTAGVPRLSSVVLKRPILAAHETDGGDIELDFPFEAPRDDGSRPAPLPSLEIVDGVFRLLANPNSAKFKAGIRLEAAKFRAVANPAPDGSWRVEGGFVPTDMALEAGEEITFWGAGNPTKGTFELHALWDKLRLTPAVRGILAPSLLEKLDAQRLEVGPHRLTVHLERDPDVEAGHVRVRPEFRGVRKMDIASLPGTETIDAVTREQINDLFGKIDLSLEVSGNRIDIRDVTTSLGGGEVRASGKIEDGGEVVDIDLRVQGLRIDDPAIWKALGSTGERVRQEFDARGTCDATISLRRARGQPFRWEAVVDLVDVTLIYKGRTDPVLKTPSGHPLHYGFPLAAEHCFGRIYIDPDGVRFDGIEGRHGGASIRVRGSNEAARRGGPTGYVKFVDGDTDVLVTVDAKNVAVDRDLEDAVEGSEFAGFLEKYRIDGVLDRLLLDIIKEPKLDDAAAVEMDIDLGDEKFRYAPFPLVLEGVTGRVSLKRARLPSGKRRKDFHVDVTGRAAGGQITVNADILESEHGGRVRVTGTGVHFDGPLEAAAFESSAIAGGLGETWEFLRPSGVADVRADLPASDDPAPEQWDVDLRDVTLHLGGEGEDRDVKIEGVKGPLRVVGGKATLSGITGRIGDGTIAVTGALEPGKIGRWDLTVDAKDLRLTRALLRAMDDAAPGSGALPAGIALEPGGRLDLGVHLLRDAVEKGRAPVRADVSVRHANLSARIGTLPVRVSGGFDVRGEDVRLDDLSLVGRGIEIRVPKAKVGKEGIEGSIFATLTDLEVTKEILNFLPASIRPSFADLTKDRILDAKDLRADVAANGAMTITGALGLRARTGAPSGGAPRGQLEFAPLRASPVDAAGDRTIDGRLLLRGLTLDVGTRLEEVSGALDVKTFKTGANPIGEARLVIDRARIAGLSVERMTVPISVRDGLLRSDPFTGDVYGGRLSGRIAVHTRAPVALEGAVRFDDVSLEKLIADVAHGRPEVSGRLVVEVEFQSRSSSMRDFTAAGTLAVREGNLGDLPPIANLPALLASVLPFSKPPTFEKADIAFTLADERLTADSLMLEGPLFEMGGYGTLDFLGNLDLTLTPQFLKSLLLPGSLQIPGVREVAGLFREDPLYLVRVRGDLANAKPILVPFPMLGPRRDAPLEFQGTPFEGKMTRRIPRSFR